jgi:hypothetical protein
MILAVKKRRILRIKEYFLWVYYQRNQYISHFHLLIFYNNLSKNVNKGNAEWNAGLIM